MSKRYTHASNPGYRRVRLDAERKTKRAEKQAARLERRRAKRDGQQQPPELGDG